MKVCTKRLSIRILSILLLGELSLGGLFLHNGVKATAAETEEIATTNLLTTTASVESENGLCVSSNSAYEGEIAGVFKGDTSLKFKFPEVFADLNDDKMPDTFYGDFKFTITDATDDSNCFDVVYYNSAFMSGSTPYYYTCVYVQYGNETRTTSNNSDTDWTTAKKYSDARSSFGPFLLSYGGNELGGKNLSTYYEKDGLLDLVWTDGVLSVKATGCDNNWTQRTIAAFDGTRAFEKGVSWGLPKMDFENGYKISFSSNVTLANAYDADTNKLQAATVTDKGTDVCFKAIVSNGTSYDLTTESMTAPSFYTEYLAWAKNNPTEEVKITDLLETTGTATANEGLRVSSENAYTGTFKGVFLGDTTLKFTFPESYTDAGDKTPDAFYGDFKFTITDATDDSNYFDIIYYNSAFVNGTTPLYYTCVYVRYGNETRTTSNNSDTEWTTAKKYSDARSSFGPFLLSYGGNPNGGKDWSKYYNEVGVLNLIWDANGVLSVKATGCDNNWKQRTIAAFDGTAAFEKGASWGLPKMNFENGYKISFSSDVTSAITYDADVDANKLQAIPVPDKGTDVCFKEISGTNLSAGTNVKSTYKYETEFENATVLGTDVYIPQNEAIGLKGVYTHAYGESWYKQFVEIDIEQTVDVSTVGEKSLTITDDTWKDTPLGEVSKTYTVHVEQPYTLTIDSCNGEKPESIVHSEHTTNRITEPENPERLFWVFDGWEIDNEEWSGDVSKFYGKNVTLKARWRDVDAPTIRLNGVNDVTYVAKGTSITVGKADVVAGDAAQNDTVSVKWALKEPNETEFTELTVETLTLNTVGSYVIRYTATDGAGYTATCERTVEVCERNVPTLTVEEGFKTQTNPGLTIAFANVTAKNVDGEVLDTTVTVVKDGVLIENDGTSFKPISVGEYTVTFLATDKAPYEYLQSIYSYTIVVLKDDVAPEIGNEFTDMTVKKNEKVTIPTVTATDNVSGNVPVEVSVYYGTQKIQLTNGVFTADQEGTYRVVLIAEDEEGNRAEKTVYVTVKTETSGGTGAGCSGCGTSGDLGLPIGLLMMMGSFVFGKNIMMKKMKRKENI